MSGKIMRQLFVGGKQIKSIFTCNYVTRRKEFGRYSIVMPETVSKKLHVPRYITYPPYVKKMSNDVTPAAPEIKSEDEIVKMKKSCVLAKFILDEAAKSVKVGVTTDDIDKIVHKLCIENDAYPSPLGYNGFPKSICTSVNNVACHGIPDKRPLKNGDIVNIDVSVFLNGYHGDCSGTYTVGEVDDKGLDLIRATKKCLRKAIEICRDGVEFRDIGRTISETAEEMGYNVVPCFAGHGIGQYFHGPPDILHFENDYPGEMKAGMTFTIEPVLTQGEPEVIILEDGWTAITADNARAAQFEHTLLITETSAQILTQSQTEDDNDSDDEED